MTINEKLIKACRSQDRMAQKQLYELLLPYLRAVANRYLRDTSYTKDVLQESFVKIFRSLDKYDFQKAPIKKWAAKVVVNTSINFNNRVIKYAIIEFDTAQHDVDFIPIVANQLTNEHLLKILKQLPKGYFEVFNLFVIDEYKHEEIAKILGISEVLSRKRLSRAKEWLKKNINEKTLWKSQIKFFKRSTN